MLTYYSMKLLPFGLIKVNGQIVCTIYSCDLTSNMTWMLTTVNTSRALLSRDRGEKEREREFKQDR